MNAVLRLGEVRRLTGLSRASIYRLVRVGMFPAPIKIGERAIGWRADEIEAYISMRPRASGGTHGEAA